MGGVLRPSFPWRGAIVLTGFGWPCGWRLGQGRTVSPANQPRSAIESWLWWLCHTTLSRGDIVPMSWLGVRIGLGVVGDGRIGVTAAIPIAEGLETGLYSWPSVWGSWWSWSTMWVAPGPWSGGRPPNHPRSVI